MKKNWLPLLFIPALAACAPTHSGSAGSSTLNLNGRWTGQLNSSIIHTSNSPEGVTNIRAVLSIAQKGNQITARLTFPDYTNVYNLRGTVDSGRLVDDSASASADFTGFFAQNSYQGNFDLVFGSGEYDGHTTGTFAFTKVGK